MTKSKVKSSEKNISEISDFFHKKSDYIGKGANSHCGIYIHPRGEHSAPSGLFFASPLRVIFFPLRMTQVGGSTHLTCKAVYDIMLLYY